MPYHTSLVPCAAHLGFSETKTAEMCFVLFSIHPSFGKIKKEKSQWFLFFSFLIVGYYYFLFFWLQFYLVGKEGEVG